MSPRTLVTLGCAACLALAAYAIDRFSVSQQARLDFTAIESRLDRSDRELAELRRQLREIQTAMLPARRAQAPEASPAQNDSDLESRIAALESALGDASRQTPGPARYLEKRRPRASTEPASTTPGAPGYEQGSSAEATFEEDAGKPFGESSDGVMGAFLAAGDDISVSDVFCKKTICKVTYSHAQSNPDGDSALDDPGPAIVDRLVDSFGGAPLDIRYAKNADGGDVMYIQLR